MNRYLSINGKVVFLHGNVATSLTQINFFIR